MFSTSYPSLVLWSLSFTLSTPFSNSWHRNLRDLRDRALNEEISFNLIIIVSLFVRKNATTTTTWHLRLNRIKMNGIHRRSRLPVIQILGMYGFSILFNKSPEFRWNAFLRRVPENPRGLTYSRRHAALHSFLSGTMLQLRGLVKTKA